MPRDMIENERSTAINPSEAVEGKVACHFGLWSASTTDRGHVLRHDRSYAKHTSSACRRDPRQQAVDGRARGARSGRIAWQFIRKWQGSSARSWADDDRRRDVLARGQAEQTRLDRAPSSRAGVQIRDHRRLRQFRRWSTPSS
jgi:hypothetical protein